MELTVNTNVPVLVGQQVAGDSAKVRKELEKVIKFTNGSMFDISDLLWTIKKNGYYEGFTTFSEYVKSLKFKERRLTYLTKMAEVMDTVGVSREKYEPLRLAKMRAITSLNPNGIWINPETKDEVPIKSFILGFIEKGQDMSYQEVLEHVKTLQGKVGAEAMGWLHLYMKEQAIVQVGRPALELAKAQIGSTHKDDEGVSKDASDGAAAEMIFASFLADPANEALTGDNNAEENEG